MLMSAKYIACGMIGFAMIVGWNVFLIKRDAALFDSAHARACQQMRSFHPDCQATP